MSTPIDIEAEVEKAASPPWETRIKVVPAEWFTTAPPPRKWLLRDGRHDGEGVLPAGKVGLLVAEGGAGKTMLVVQLALAVATGTKWLGTFDVPQAGKVLLILGEEDEEEVHRRVHRAAREREAVPTVATGAITTLPLAGVACPMIEDGDDGPFLFWLRTYVEGTGPYSLIVVDPVSRFSGADAEKDNAAGTRFCQALESLVTPSGGATILATHHVNKSSRGSGATLDASSARGSSAIVDGVRWVSTVAVEYIPGAPIDLVITFAVAKTNYAKKPPFLNLWYTDEGVLVPLDEEGRTAADKARDEADPKARRRKKDREAKTSRDAEVDAAVLSCIRGTPGIGTTELRTQVRATANCGSDAADTAVARCIQRGLVQRKGNGKTKEHFVVDEPPEHGAATMPPTMMANDVTHEGLT